MIEITKDIEITKEDILEQVSVRDFIDVFGVDSIIEEIDGYEMESLTIDFLNYLFDGSMKGSTLYNIESGLTEEALKNLRNHLR